MCGKGCQSLQRDRKTITHPTDGSGLLQASDLSTEGRRMEGRQRDQQKPTATVPSPAQHLHTLGAEENRHLGKWWLSSSIMSCCWQEGARGSSLSITTTHRPTPPQKRWAGLVGRQIGVSRISNGEPSHQCSSCLQS